jgi:predicted MPP superfamily phosphohydrolase
MALFLLAALHLYIGARLLPPLPPAWAWAGAALLCALLALFITGLSPVLRRRPGVMAWLAYSAIGFFSSLLVLTLLRDVALIGVWLGAPARLAPLARSSALAVPALALVASAVGFANARRRPAVRRVRVPIDGLAPALEGFSIVQISDLHVGPTIRQRFVDAVVDAANGLGADLAVVTGDVVDGSVAELAQHTAPLGRLAARHGAWLVTGNHEYYSHAPTWIEEFRRIGLGVLLNEHVVLDHAGAQLVLAGVTDYSAHHFEPTQRSDPERALAGAPPQARPRILLAHQPRSAAAAEAAGFDVQLSGHTHGGQFLPWVWLVQLQQPYTAGLHRHGRLWVYISRGTGYWGPPKRLGAPSEITLLSLYNPSLSRP